VTNRVTPGKVILGELGDIESGVRQLIRKRPLEVTEVGLPSGHVLRVPTPDETLRIKGYLIVRRNQVRDYLDVAALSDRYGLSHAADVLGHIDTYYSDQRDADSERDEVAAEIRGLVRISGLSKQDFAQRTGTSRTRLSTYMSGKVTPSAALVVRMRRVALHAQEQAIDAARRPGTRPAGREMMRRAEINP
jgi:DNA-binding transcriptional regulator YiaG